MALPTVVVVDPFGSGRYLGSLLHRTDLRTIAVISTPLHPDWVRNSLHEEDFDHIFDIDTAPETLVAELSRMNVRAVIPGWETGVEFTDWLAERLCVPGNGTALSRCRRYKPAMADRLRECAIPAAEHVVAKSLGELLDWAKERDDWPVVVKPVASGGSDDINICHSLSDVTTAFQSIVEHVNVLGNENREVMGQEFLDGQQYLVNTASADGHHYVGEIWRFDSRYEEGTQIYDIQELLEPSGPVQDLLVDYALRVLDALGIRNGAGHTEIMLTRRGPILIETAARMTGGINGRALHAAVGHDHASLTAEAYLEPARLRARPPRYRLKKRVGIVALRSRVRGKLAAGWALDELRGLPTLMGSTKPLAEGTPVEPTHSFVTSPGLLYLVADSMAEIERDTAAVRRIEASGCLYGGDDELAR